MAHFSGMPTVRPSDHPARRRDRRLHGCLRVGDHSGAIPSEGLALASLATKQERFRIRSAAADLERTEVLMPITRWHIRPRIDPETKLIEIGDVDCPVAHSVDQVLADTWRQIAPTLDFGHQLPKTMRPS